MVFVNCLFYLLTVVVLSVNAQWSPSISNVKPMMDMAKLIAQDTEKKMKAMRHTQLRSQYHPAFETGWVNCRIQEKYRMMVDRMKNVLRYYKKAHLNMENIMMLEEQQNLYWEIQNLAGMLHEIERKYKIDLDPNERYRDTTPAPKRNKTITMPKTRSRKIKEDKIEVEEGPEGEGDEREGKKEDFFVKEGSAATKKRRLKTPFNLKDFFKRTTTTRKRPLWEFRPLDYGWEMSYDWWNINPQKGRVDREPPEFYHKYPLPAHFINPYENEWKEQLG